MFSDFKNSTTGKAPIVIPPHGTGLLSHNIYPHKIKDTEITVKVGATGRLGGDRKGVDV